MSFKFKKLYAVTDYIVIFLGLCIYSFGWTGFIMSHNITTGGLAGISFLIARALGIAVAWPYNIINGFLLIMAIIILGWRFSLKTIFSVITLAVVIPIFEHFFRQHGPLLSHDITLAVVIGSILTGASLGSIFSVNGSTGGTDIIAAIINKYKPISIGTGLMVIDVFTLGASYFVFHNPDLLVYSVVEVMIVNFTVDFALNGYRQGVQFFIFTSKPHDVANTIMGRIKRGCTFLHAEGAYSGKSTKVVMVVARRNQSTNIFRIVKEIDPNAFITQSLVKGAFGAGFDAIKVSSKKNKSTQSITDQQTKLPKA